MKIAEITACRALRVHHESPSPFNPLGVKGVGEGGTVPVAATVISAVENALEPFGVRITRAPITPVELLRLLSSSPSRNTR